MSELVTVNKEKKARKHKKGLQSELKRLIDASKTGDISIDLSSENLSSEEAVTVRLINEVIGNYRSAMEYDIMKYKLTSDALCIALWDMDVVSEDLVNPANKITWSQEFREMVGFSDENDFPNVLSSWSDRLHPEDKERVLNAFAAHMSDHTGRTPYDIQYRLMLKNGHYRHFRAFGTSLRDDAGTPLRIAGAVMDINEKKQMGEALREALYESNKTRYELERSKKMLYAVNNAAILLLKSDVETFNHALYQSMKMIVEAVKVDRMYIWKNHIVDGKLCSRQIYEWSENAEPQQDKEFTIGVSYEDNVPRWERELSNGKCINDIVRNTPPEEQVLLSMQGIVSLLVAPVFIKEQFWGFVGFDDCYNERVFTNEEESILRSASMLFANALIRDEMKRKLMEEKEFNRVMFEAAPIGLSVYNEKLEFLNCNDVLLNMFNATLEQYNENLYRFMPEYQPDGQKSRDKAMDIMVRALSGEDITLEWMYKSFAGESIPCEITLTRIRYNEQFIGLAYIYDLRNIRTIEAEAEEANKRTRIMLDSNPIICILRDENNEIIDCNQEALRILGVSTKTEFINNFHKFYPETQPDGTKSSEKAKLMIRTLIENGSLESYEWILQNIKGEQFPVETKMVIIQWEGLNRILSYSRDLREIKAKEKELLEIAEREREAELQREAAQAANEAKGRFLAHMSHEIRTPMNAILGMSELLLQEKLSTRQLQYVNDMYISAKALLDIINDILDVSKLQAGKLTLVPVHFDFSALIENVRTIAQFLIGDKNIVFKFDIQEETPVCLYGDDVRLRQALLNILSNAVKFTEKGQVQFTINCTDDTIRMAVSDTGLGIPTEKIPSLFEAFEQADIYKNRKTTGTGLGLTITKAIIEMMGGKIRVESVYGQGTSFHIEIPKVLGDENLIHRSDSKDTSLYAPDAKVLVVDDNQINLNVANGLLQLYHIEVDNAISGKQSIEMVQKKQYDIVLMDYMMPEMTGTEATQLIRESGNSVPIISLTASAVVGAKEMMLEAGMDDYLAKPIIKFELLQMLKKWLPPEKLLNPPSEEITHDGSLDEEHKVFWDRIEKINGLSVATGLCILDGRRESYKKTLKLMISECDKSNNNLNEFLSANDMINFRIEIHGLKGALANIGMTELSAKALELEKASADMDIEFCNNTLPPFLELLDNLCLELKEAFTLDDHNVGLKEIPAELRLTFQKMIDSFNEADLNRIEKEVENLRALNLSGALEEETERIIDMVMMMDYDEATESIRILLQNK